MTAGLSQRQPPGRRTLETDPGALHDLRTMAGSQVLWLSLRRLAVMMAFGCFGKLLQNRKHRCSCNLRTMAALLNNQQFPRLARPPAFLTRLVHKVASRCSVKLLGGTTCKAFTSLKAMYGVSSGLRCAIIARQAMHSSNCPTDALCDDDPVVATVIVVACCSCLLSLAS